MSKHVNSGYTENSIHVGIVCSWQSETVDENLIDNNWKFIVGWGVYLRENLEKSGTEMAQYFAKWETKP